MLSSTVRVLAGGFGVAVVIPFLVFLSSALGAGLDLGESLRAMAEQCRAPRQNLLVLTALGLAPVALLALGLAVMARLSPRGDGRPVLAAAGLVPGLAVLFWAHSDFWPLFFPDRVYPGFPHGLGLVIGPLFFAPVSMALGLLPAWALLRRRRAKERARPDDPGR